MKKLIYISLLLLSTVTFSQITNNLGDFNSVKVFDKIKVELISSSENKISITGNKAEQVETVNKNGELKIRMSFDKLLSGEDIVVKLYFKKLEEISASEGGEVGCKTVFKQTSLALKATSGAVINIKADVDKINVNVNAGGIIALSGKASNQDVTITSGGVLNSKNLYSSQTTISVSAGGKATINATNLVDAKVKAGGSIYIYGKPKQINKQTLFGGTIEEKQ